MTDLNPTPSDQTPPADDPLSHLHKMSTTAGLGTTEYVAVNGVAIVALILGVASSLSLFDPILLVIPGVAIVLAIAAFVQIKNSNGTQTGRGLAGLGLFLALGFMALVGGRAVVELYRNREDEKVIDQVIISVDEQIQAGKYGEAYTGYFADRFTSRFKLDNFTDQWKHLVNDFHLSSMRSNGRMEFQINPDTGQKSAYGMTILQFGSNSTRFVFVFEKEPDNSWKITDIPDLFKVQQPQASPSRQRQ